VKFGLMIHHGPEMAERNMWDLTRAFGVAAEESGFDSLWLADHWFHGPPQNPPGWSPMLDVWVALSALAAVTDRVKLGQLVLGTPYRNPALTAKMATSLDVVSHGRSILGLGAGWHKVEYEMYGYEGWEEPPDRLRRLREAVQVTLALWKGREPVSYEGKIYRLKDAINHPPPVQQPHPPLMIGGSGEKVTLKLVAQYADWANCTGNPDALRHKLGVLREHCRTVGRDYETIVKSWYGWSLIGRTRADYEAKLAALGARRRAFHGVGGMPDELIAGFRELAAAGAQVCIVQMNGEDDPDAVRLFGETVIPALADA
jgi:F420-dependent oxidoreductase-like protein